jgi:hypothetical protein
MGLFEAKGAQGQHWGNEDRQHWCGRLLARYGSGLTRGRLSLFHAVVGSFWGWLGEGSEVEGAWQRVSHSSRSSSQQSSPPVARIIAPLSAMRLREAAARLLWTPASAGRRVMAGRPEWAPTPVKVAAGRAMAAW